MSRLVTITLFLILSLSAAAQSTQKLTANKVNEYGLIYTLPTTALDITIYTERVVKNPGVFYNYARKYLNIDNPISEPSDVTTITSIVVTPRGVANDEERYLMQFKSGSTPFLILNEENMPLAINTEKFTPNPGYIPEAPLPLTASPLDSPEALQVFNEEMLQSQSTAKQAELAAAQLYALRQFRSDLITGQAEQMPPDGQSMQLILNNINAQEAALTAMFLGVEQRATDVKTITYIPDTAIEDFIVARLSATEGVVDANNLTGEPIYLSLKITERGTLPVNERGEVKRFPKGGVAYRIPGKAAVIVEYRGKEMFNSTLDIAQYGVVFGLDPSIFTNKKAPAYLIFDPVTGAIKELGTVNL